ncbi:hypothetical protein EDB84DRAFT_1480085 [Lactarius hengduanensis]|nr:hypothetical protein EDB84DRAFT_1480085 [Lactarius hengduanensis]
MKSTLILTATFLLAAAAAHGSVVKVKSSSAQNPSGVASVSSSASYASGTPGISSGIPSGIPSGAPSGLPTGTPLASTFTPKATYTTGTVSA